MIDALWEARELQLAAARVGFDWPDARGAMSKLREEVDELDRAMADGAHEQICSELGDVLFSVVNVSRFVSADAAESLRASSRKFSVRFAGVQEEVARSGRRIEECSLEELDSVWDAMKNRETGGDRPVQ